MGTAGGVITSRDSVITFCSRAARLLLCDAKPSVFAVTPRVATPRLTSFLINSLYLFTSVWTTRISFLLCRGLLESATCGSLYHNSRRLKRYTDWSLNTRVLARALTNYFPSALQRRCARRVVWKSYKLNRLSSNSQVELNPSLTKCMLTSATLKFSRLQRIVAVYSRVNCWLYCFQF